MNQDNLQDIFDKASKADLSFNELTQSERTYLASSFREVSLIRNLYQYLNQVYLVIPKGLDPATLNATEPSVNKLVVYETDEGEYLTPVKVLTNVRPGEPYFWLMSYGVFDWKITSADRVNILVDESNQE